MMNDESYTIMLELNLGDREPGWTIAAVRRHASGEGEEMQPRQRVVPDIALAMVEGLGPYEQFVRNANIRAEDKARRVLDMKRRAVAELEAAESAWNQWMRVTDTIYPEASDQGAGDDSPAVASYTHCSAHLDYTDVESIPSCDLSMNHYFGDQIAARAIGFDKWGCPPNCPRRQFREAHQTVNVGEEAISDVKGPEDLRDVAAHLRGGWLGENAAKERVEEVLRTHVKISSWTGQTYPITEHLINEHNYDQTSVPRLFQQKILAHANDHRPYVEQLAREREARGKTGNEGKGERNGTDE